MPPELAEQLRRSPRRPALARVRKAVGEALEAAGARPLPEPEAAPIEGRWRFDVDVNPPGYEWSPPLR